MRLIDFPPTDNRKSISPLIRPIVFNREDVELYLPLEENGLLEDISGNGRHGTIIGATWTGDNLNFVTDDYATFGDILGFDDGETAFSGGFWMGEVPNDKFAIIVGKSVGTGDQEGWEVQYNTFADTMAISIRSSAGDRFVVTFNNLLVANPSPRQHIAFSYDGVRNIIGSLTLWVNGDKITDKTLTHSSLSASITNAGVFTLGARNAGTSGTFIDANISRELFICSGELSDAEVKNIYRAGVI